MIETATMKASGIPESEMSAWSQSELFDQVPLNIAVIDRDYNVLQANSNFEEYFGEWKERKCFQVYKRSETPCEKCTAMDTFEDALPRVHQEQGQDVKGNPTHYLVHTAPVRGVDGSVSRIMEMSQNVTDIKRQQQEYQTLFERVPSYIAVLDRNMRIVRANENLREAFGECKGKLCYEVYKRRDSVCDECPARMTFQDGRNHTSTHVGVSKDGKETHYVVVTSPLEKDSGGSTHVLEILTDITHIKELEKEKLEAERLAAVGQTVAGLAHSVKNILMGLEGGVYMLGTGIERDDRERLSEGWETLQRNIAKVTSLVKDFLSFSKGRTPSVRLVNPDSLVQEIVELYRESAKSLGIELICTPCTSMEPAPLDPDGIHTCLTNLVSNAIDACQTSGKDSCHVRLGSKEEDNTVVFEVSDDGSGIEYDIQKKVFSTFFTTKGGQGTGLGLLTTRKIIQEHGGKISLESDPGKGSLFRIELPRDRLPALVENRSE